MTRSGSCLPLPLRPVTAQFDEPTKRAADVWETRVVAAASRRPRCGLRGAGETPDDELVEAEALLGGLDGQAAVPAFANTQAELARVAAL